MTEIKDLKNQKGAYKVEQLYLEWILHRIKLDEVLDTKFKKKNAYFRDSNRSNQIDVQRGRKKQDN